MDVTVDSTAQVAVVLVGEEDLFLDLLQRFPARRYPVVFANDLKEAGDRFKLYHPQVLIVPAGSGIDVPATAEVVRTARRRDTKVIGLGKVDELPADLAELLDEVTPEGDVNALLEAVAAALRERRIAPRANIDVLLTISGLGDLRATVISGRSLFVPTDSPLKTGRMAQIDVDAGSARLRCWARVVRVGEGEQGQHGMVLGIGEREHAIRAFLDGLVRGALLLERAEVGSQDPVSELPDSVSDRLEQRVQQEVTGLRARLESQVALTEALNSRLDSLVQSEEHSVKWKDVRPVLVKKWSAQREVIKTLIERVNKLTATQRAASKLQGALETEEGLHRKLEEQEALIETLRARIDQVIDGAHATTDKPVADDPASASMGKAQQRLEQTLSAQGNLVESLAERVEVLASRGLPAREIGQAQKTLDDHAAQIASLTLRLDELRDQLRMGQADQQQVSGLQEQANRGQENLEQQLKDPLGSLEIGQWAPMPQLGGATNGSDAVDPSPDAQTVKASALPQESTQVDHTPSPVPLPAEVPPPAAASPDAGDSTFEPATEAMDPLMTNRGGSLGRMPKWLYLLAPIAGALLGLGVFGALRVSGVIGGSSGPVVAKAGQGDAAAKRGDTGVSADVGAVVVKSPGPKDARVADAGSAVKPPDEVVGAAESAPDGGVVADTSAKQPPRTTKRQRRQAERRRAAAARRVKRKRYMRLGKQSMARRRYRESRRYLTTALKLKDDYRVRRLLARSHEMVGELWAASHHLKRCIALSPARLRPKRYDELGKIYAKLGKKALACHNFRSAVRLRPSFSRAQAHVHQYCGK